MARELCALHARARCSNMAGALSMTNVHAPGQLRASRTSIRDVEAIIFEPCRCTQ